MNNVACTHTDHTEHLLTPEEVQQRLRCGRDALREQCRLGLPVIRIGQRRRFDWAQCVQWLREHNKQRGVTP